MAAPQLRKMVYSSLCLGLYAIPETVPAGKDFIQALLPTLHPLSHACLAASLPSMDNTGAKRQTGMAL